MQSLLDNDEQLVYCADRISLCGVYKNIQKKIREIHSCKHFKSSMMVKFDLTSLLTEK